MKYRVSFVALIIIILFSTSLFSLSSRFDTNTSVPTTDLLSVFRNIDDSRVDYFSILENQYFKGLEPAWKIELTDRPNFIINTGPDKLLVSLDEAALIHYSNSEQSELENDHFILVIDTDGNLLNTININGYSVEKILNTSTGHLTTIITSLDHDIVNIAINDFGKELIRIKGDACLLPSPDGNYLISQKGRSQSSGRHFILDDPFGKKEIALDRFLNIDGSTYGIDYTRAFSDKDKHVLYAFENQLLFGGKNEQAKSWKAILYDLSMQKIIWERDIYPLSSVPAVSKSTDDSDQFILFKHPSNPQNIGYEVVSKNSGEIVSKIQNWDIYDTQGSTDGLFYSTVKVRHKNKFEYFVIKHNEKSEILSYAMRLQGRTKNKLQILGGCAWQSYEDCWIDGDHYPAMTVLYIMGSDNHEQLNSPIKARSIAIEGIWTVTSIDNNTYTIIGYPGNDGSCIAKYVFSFK